ncbi:MAG TPA: 5'-nucleotidase, lipoprotein e(P4) family [Cyclobacteriaceae bacterium]|jgi:5'-nucleotidase (lipoprotein e(P4) family)|nr:5'-nucleotidase, lipoprotein e(P4) family [Cyclobacteriaceae bacterium]
MKHLFLVLSFFTTATFAQDSALVKQVGEDIKLLPVLWQQQSAEYRALCYQAFNLATLRLEKIKTSGKANNYAIITDIDETILDNSYYEAQRIKDHTEFDMQTWKQWTYKASATPVPGAVEFLQKAKQKGITIFYVSNRDTSEVKSTILNLKKFQLPDADANHLLFYSNKSSKEERRQIISKKYNVVMLLGDNLNDFTQLFEKKSSNDRKTETDNVKNEWGNKFIVLPNATYGEWENALYDYERKLTPEQRDKKLKDKLTGIE